MYNLGVFCMYINFCVEFCVMCFFSNFVWFVLLVSSKYFGYSTSYSTFSSSFDVDVDGVSFLM